MRALRVAGVERYTHWPGPGGGRGAIQGVQRSMKLEESSLVGDDALCSGTPGQPVGPQQIAVTRR